MKLIDHLKRFKLKLKFLIKLDEEMKSAKEDDIDYSIFFNEGYWASYHLISALLDYLDIPEKLKHKNHRNIKQVLKSNEVIQILGDDTNSLYELYTKTLDFSSKGEYGKIKTISKDDFITFKGIIKKIKKIIETLIGSLNEIQ